MLVRKDHYRQATLRIFSDQSKQIFFDSSTGCVLCTWVVGGPLCVRRPGRLDHGVEGVLGVVGVLARPGEHRGQLVTGLGGSSGLGQHSLGRRDNGASSEGGRGRDGHTSTASTSTRGVARARSSTNTWTVSPTRAMAGVPCRWWALRLTVGGGPGGHVAHVVRGDMGRGGRGTPAVERGRHGRVGEGDGGRGRLPAHLWVYLKRVYKC